MNIHSFPERLEFSHRQLDDSLLQAIKELIPGCASVRRATPDEDRYDGIDVFAKLRSGVELGIDLKVRDREVKKLWRGDEPELTLERYSAWYSPDDPRNSNGWTLNSKKSPHFVLYGWQPEDTRIIYLVAFQPLRAAFIKFGKDWLDEYGMDWCETERDGRRWRTGCIYVPASKVLEAIKTVSRGVRRPVQREGDPQIQLFVTGEIA